MDRQDKIKLLVEEFAGMNYGETLEHFRIASLIEEGVNTSEYRYIVKKAKKQLLECGKMIANVKGAGYRVVCPDEYSFQSSKCVMAGARRIDYGTKILQNAPVKDMTLEGRQTYNSISDRMRILQAAMTGAKVEINMLSSKRENPLLKMIEQSQGVSKSTL